MMESTPGWSALLPDLLVEIAVRVAAVEDFMALRGVCSSWRAAATMDKVASVAKWWPRVPLLMLAEKKESDEREFYSLSTRKIAMTLPLPEAKRKRCIEARFGWLLTQGFSGEGNLLNPFSRAQVELPDFRTIPDYFDAYQGFAFISRAVLSANPSDASDDFVLMVTSGLYLGFWRPGDENWTRIESGKGASANIGYYQGKFYGIKYYGGIWVWDPSSSGPNLAVADEIFIVNRQLLSCRMSYLVESSQGELLVITRNAYQVQDDDHNYGVTNFGVIRLDVTKREWEEITSSSTGLGRDAIFIGDNAAISVAASVFLPDVIKPNCIYFTDDCVEAYHGEYLGEGTIYHDLEDGGSYIEYIDVEPPEEGGGGKDMGVYNLQDGKIERLGVEESLSFISPPLWIHG